jgi:formylmethanofuran dehydrogenase subunit E
MKKIIYITALLFISCSGAKKISFEVIDTDFSKGRLKNQQTITLDDFVKFHGHLCDGLVLGSLAMQQGLKELYPNQPVDRTNLRIVSKPSPCLTDVAIYVTGGRYQFNTFYVDNSIKSIYVIQRIDNGKSVSVSLNPGVKPSAIDSLGNLAVKKELSSCGLDSLRKLEDDFTKFLLKSNPDSLFTVSQVANFVWSPVLKNDFQKTDVLNKEKEDCGDK